MHGDKCRLLQTAGASDGDGQGADVLAHNHFLLAELHTRPTHLKSEGSEIQCYWQLENWRINARLGVDVLY